VKKEKESEQEEKQEEKQEERRKRRVQEEREKKESKLIPCVLFARSCACTHPQICNFLLKKLKNNIFIVSMEMGEERRGIKIKLYKKYKKIILVLKIRTTPNFDWGI
jgi:hypothetical protein